MNVAWSILNEKTKHGGATWPAVHPYSQRSILGALASFEEPEKGVDRIVLLFAQVVQTTGWEMDIAGIATHAFGGLTNVILIPSVQELDQSDRLLTSFQLKLTPSPNLDSFTVTPSGVDGN